MITKRLFDFICSLIGLLVFSPLFVLIAFWIKVDSKGPVFFRQERVGYRGRLFKIRKFRTMRVDAEREGLQVTVGSDPRITRAGTFLRKYKLDELPQLIDVLFGNMSLVGPRPEVPRYMALYPEATRAKVLSVRPGISDWASIQFKSESALLEKAVDAEFVYIHEVLPIKQGLYVEYVENRSFWGDVKVILTTMAASARGV